MNAYVYRYHKDGNRHKKNFAIHCDCKGEINRALEQKKSAIYVVYQDGKLTETNVPDALRETVLDDAREADLSSFKSRHVQIARELCYPLKWIKKLEAAKTENEIVRIMRDARLA